jgi:hypothetical protein
MAVALSLGMFGLGMVLLTLGVYQAVTAVDYWREWPKAQAVVIENKFRTVRSKNGSVVVAEPVFRFTVGGRTVEAVSRVGRAPPEFSPGDRVTIAYDPTNPARVTQKVDVREAAFIMAGVGAGLGLGGLAMGVLFWFLLNRRTPSRDDPGWPAPG